MLAPAPIPTILVVDDDEGLLVLIEGALQAEKWNVAIAASGADALSWLQKNCADLLLLDLKLRDIEGRKLIGAMADAGRFVPFIVITGQGDERVAVDLMKHGALDYLVKDVNFIEFIPTVVRRAFARLADGKRLLDAEAELRQSEERYRTLFTTLIEGFCIIEVIFDAQGRPVDYRFLQVNPAFANQTGLPNAQGKLMRDLAPKLEAHWFEIYGQIALTGEPVRFVKEAKALNRWFDVSAYRLGGAESRKVAILFNDITERKRLEKEILEISERERRSFGQDLHDGLGQRLTGLEMLSNALAVNLKRHALAAAKQAVKLNRELRKTVTEARLISHGLAPVPMDGEGLMHGLRALTVSTNQIPKVACRFTCDPPVCIQDVTTATHLYRIAQEAVNNALKHGRAKEIHMTLTEGSEGVELAIENNGRAFPKANREQHGMGLNVMRYRAEMIGATLSIETGKRQGVQVICTLRRKT